MKPKQPLTFAIARHDDRSTALCRLLRADGHTALGFDSPGGVPPVEALPEGAVVIAPSLSAQAAEALDARGIRAIAYQQREECILAQAVITAENALQVAMDSLETTLADAAILVIGYGRIGKALAAMLRGLGCNIWVSARKAEDLAAIALAGHSPLETGALEPHLPGFSLIFNTVPADVLGADRLALLDRDCLIIDLASVPGGVDYEAADAMGLQTIQALALPGRLTPISSAKAIQSTVYRILTKEGLL